MTRMFASDPHCKGATMSLSGQNYNADRQGIVHVEDGRDVKALVAGGFVIAGGMPRLKKFWVCKNCNWEAAINSCPKCGSKKLKKVVVKK